MGVGLSRSYGVGNSRNVAGMLRADALHTQATMVEDAGRLPGPSVGARYRGVLPRSSAAAGNAIFILM